MTDYRAPLADIRFTFDHIADLSGVLELSAFDHVDPDLVEGALDEAARFMEQVVAPTNRDGDTVGSQRNDDGSVTTAPGFVEAYNHLVDAGWAGIQFDPAYGGGGFPWLAGMAIQEMLTSSNMAFSLCPMLTQGAIDALAHHGSEEQRETYLPKMVTGEWAGTMNLTEPHAGSDVGALTTKAVPQGDGTYRISGQKIFITYGEHDLTDNIVHLVLARTPDAPPGTKGISLFIVPKFMVNDDGSLGDRNDVTCVSIEHKMGIHGSPTCVLSFGDNDGAIGYLIGEENAGMRYMFTMMNTARLSVGLEGLAIAERSYQLARQYAHDRSQGTAPGAPKGASSAIVEHPDVQRMLLDMKVAIDGMRALVYTNAWAIDMASHGDEGQREMGDERAALLTPLSKGWCTDMGVEVSNIGIQVHGGTGYVEESGAAQHLRDSRIAPIYEGTNGIQAMDLVARKLPMRGGGVIKDHLTELEGILGRLDEVDGLDVVRDQLGAAISATAEATTWLLANAPLEPRDALGGATSYLRMLAVTTAGAYMAKGLLSARDSLSADELSDRSLLLRHFAVSQLALVPGYVAQVTEGHADLSAATERILAV